VTITVTDLFCGAGGSSLGAESAGLQWICGRIAQALEAS